MQFKIHKSFKLNGFSFSEKDQLIEYSNAISSEIGLFLTHFLDDSAIVKLQTSGSTGTPKIIEVNKESMINSAKATGLFFELNERINALLCMNPTFVGGKMMLVRALVLGWNLDVVEPNLKPLKELKRTYDFCAMVPLQVFNSLTELHMVKQLIIGGGTVPGELKKELEEISTKCYSTYGMTETVSHIAVKKLNNFSLLEESVAKHAFYKTLPGISISRDHRNCLEIRAPKIADEIIVTNDVVELISDSEFKWLGRFDNMINSGGIKLNPELIEEKLAVIMKQRFFVTGIKDIELGEKLVLIIEGVENADCNLSEVKKLKSLNKYEQPKEIYYLENFIETATKKVQRKRTLEQLFFTS